MKPKTNKMRALARYHAKIKRYIKKYQISYKQAVKLIDAEKTGKVYGIRASLGIRLRNSKIHK